MNLAQWFSWSFTKSEFKLFIRQKSVVAYLGLVTVLIGVVFFFSKDDPTQKTVLALVNNILFFQFPILVFVVAPFWLRNKKVQQDWFWATPADVVFWWSGITSSFILFTFLATSWFSLLITGLFTFTANFSLVQLGWLYFYTHLFLWLLTTAELFFISFLSNLIPHILGVSAVVFTLSGLIWLGVLMPFASLLTPLNFTLLGVHLNPILGWGAERDLLLAYLFLVVITAGYAHYLTIFLLTWFEKRAGWSAQKTGFLYSTAVLGLILVGFSAAVYQHQRQQKIVPSTIISQIDSWQVLEAHYTFTMDHSLEVKAFLVVQNQHSEPQTELELRLNPGFKVTMAEINQQTAPITTSGEGVKLTAASPILPQQPVSITLTYHGRPILLREDYEPIRPVLGNHPPSYAQPVISYSDGSFLQLNRDTDWFIWPFNSGEQLAQNSHSVELLWRTNRPVNLVHTGEEKGQSLVWSRPPALLAFTPPTAKFGLPQQAIIEPVLAELFPTTPPQWLILPYGKTIVFTPQQLGLPLDLLTSLKGDTRTRSVNLAIQLKMALLYEKIQRPVNQLTQTGLFTNFSINCSVPDENGVQSCEKKPLVADNPQVPHKRWHMMPEPTPLVQAWAIIWAYHHFLPAEVQTQELAKWQTIANEPGGGLTLIPSITAATPLGGLEFNNNCQLAQYVLTLEQLYQQQGDNFFENWLNALTNSAQPAEVLIWQTASNLLKKEVHLLPTPCLTQ